MFSFEATRVTHMPADICHAFAHMLWTMALWSNDLALPLRSPCSATVLSVCTTMLRSRSSCSNVEIPAKRAHAHWTSASEGRRGTKGYRKEFQ